MTAQAGQDERRIVVGADGSEESRAALRWSAEEAALRGAALEAVLAWDLPFVGLGASYSPAPAGLPSAEEYARRAEETLDQMLLEVLDDPSVVRRTVRQGSPAQVLLDRARGAYLLAVGSRGHGGFTGLLLGSVSEKVVRYASCSVVVVRP